MNAGRVFVDTNILIYAHDLDFDVKYEIAGSILKKLWREGAGDLSPQVLEEFYENVTRKIPESLSPAKARGILENYMAWHEERNGPESILRVSEIEARHLLSFWDSLMVAAACNAKADKFLTKGLNHGQIIEGVVMENPFLDPKP